MKNVSIEVSTRARERTLGRFDNQPSFSKRQERVPEMKNETNHRTSLHVVNSFLRQPVEGFEEKKKSEQSHKFR